VLEWHLLDEQEAPAASSPSLQPVMQKLPVRHKVVGPGIVLFLSMITIALYGMWHEAKADPQRHALALLETIQLQNGTGSDEINQFARRFGHELRTTSPDALWRSRHSLQTQYFQLAFRASDQEAVVSLAATLDQEYAALRQDFGLPPPEPADQILIDVVLESNLRASTNWLLIAQKISISSPALLPISNAGTEAEVLMQQVITVLLLRLTDEAMQQTPVRWQWAPMVVAFRRWQWWRHSNAMSDWRQMAHWLYRNAHADSTDSTMKPATASEPLCRRALVLEFASAAIATLTHRCDNATNAKLILQTGKPPMRLDELIAPNREWQNQEYGIQVNQGYGRLAWHQYLPLETVIDYAVMTYGRDRLPVLLVALGQHDDWQSLIPAVFNVTADEFEQGWRDYLVALR
jgi:hypothetical protein